MLLQLRHWGQRTVHGDEFKDFGSEFTMHVNTLVFEAALVPINEEDGDTDDVETTPMMRMSDP
jgi:hypothetical protein